MKNSVLRAALAAAFALGAALTGRGFTFDNGPTGTPITVNPGSFTMAIRLGTTPVLTDGSNFSTSVLAAMDEWNAVLGRAHFVGNILPPGGVQLEEDRVDEIVFSATVYGLAYNPGVIAVTMARRAGTPRADGTWQRVQADIFFNTANRWDSYRGARQQNPLDIHRTALHELGHVLGLEHPNVAGQNVAAVMNNSASEQALTADDIAGGQALYGPAGSVTRPVNNDFAAATEFTGTSMTGANGGATKQIGEPNHATGNFGGASVWWRWVAPATGSLRLTTAGSNFDTMLGVYTGPAVNSLTQLANNDDEQAGVVRTSAVTLNVTAGTTFLFGVDGFDSETGNIALNLTLTPAGGGGGPVIATTLPNQLVTTGNSVSFFAPGNTGTVQWQVSTDGGATFTNLANNATFSGVTTRVLTVSGAAAANGAFYRYVLTDSGGSTASNAARLTVAEAFFPQAVALAADAAGNVYVADVARDNLQRFTGAGVLTVFAGTTGQAGTADGTGAAARFNDPTGLAIAPDGTVFVADTANGTIRRITAAGVVTTFAGSITARGNVDGPGAQATFSAPTGIARDVAGGLFVTDSANHTIRRIAVDGTVSTFAGTVGAAGSTDGTGAAARFNRPTGIALDAAGNLFVTDATNNTIRRITPAGVVSTLAGLAGVSGSADGSGAGALFNNPTGVAVNAAGNIFVTDTGNSTIRQITPVGVVTTLAGLSGIAGLTDGVGADAWFNQPRAVAVLGADLIVADTGNFAIRRIAANGTVTTLALNFVAATPPAVTPTPTPTPTPAPSGGGGGGGAPSIIFAVILPLLLVGRWLRRARSTE